MTRALTPKTLTPKKNTAKHSVLSTLFENKKSKPSKKLQNTEKYVIFLIIIAKFVHAQSCKTSIKTVFSTICGHMLLAPLPNNMFQNTVNYSFSTNIEVMVQAFLLNNLRQNIVNYSVSYPFNGKGLHSLAKRLAPKHCNLQCFLTIL